MNVPTADQPESSCTPSVSHGPGSRPLRIGPLTVDPPVLQAPMAGYTNYAFRQIVRDYGGVGLQATEMISARGFVWRDQRDCEHPDRLWGIRDEPRPLAVQIWDNDPVTLAHVGARLVQEYHVSVVDLNFGCPVRQVTERAQSGSYLLRDPQRMGRIIEQVVQACAPAPVTAKIRLGCSREMLNAVEVAQVVESAGAAALTVHGRTAADFFRGAADWQQIARIRPYLKRIPLIGNGDLVSAQQVVDVFRDYAVDGVMVARACLGRPWLFRQIQAALRGEPVPEDPTLDEQRACLLRHYGLVVKRFGEQRGTMLMRKYACCYAQGLPGARRFRAQVACAHTQQEFQLAVQQSFPREREPVRRDGRRPQTGGSQSPDAGVGAMEPCKSSRPFQCTSAGLQVPPLELVPPGPSHEPGPLAIPALEQLARVPFDSVSIELKREAYGVPYVQLTDVSGGCLWVNRHGWRHLRQLDPGAWYFDEQYSRRGRPLSEGSGAVFHVPGQAVASRPVDLVVKFSRLAQEVMLYVCASAPVTIQQDELESAAFNDPLQEFALLEELRTSRFGPSDLRVLTKRPLAIYSPARSFEPWQLGRTADRFRRHSYQLEKDQAAHRGDLPEVHLAIERQYVMLFHWVRGDDAASLVRHGVIPAPKAASLVIQATQDLAAKGFRVLDMKPNHIILRHRPGRGLLRRRDRPVFAVVDFELLQRTEEYSRWRHSAPASA